MLSKLLSNKNILNYLLGLIIFFIFIFLIPNLGGGFTQIDFDTDTPTFANYARNLINLDFSITKGLAIHAISSTGETVIDNKTQYSWYVDHPPTLYWLIVIAMKVFGVNLFSARLVSIIASVLLAIYIFKILKKFKYSRIFSFFILIGTPLYIEHGLVPGYQSITLLFLTISVFYFSKFIDSEKNNKKFLFLSLCFWFLSLLSDWPAYFFAIPLFVYFLKNKSIFYCVLSIILPILTYFLLVGYDSYVVSGNFYNPIGRLVSLASSDPVQPLNITIKNILKWFLRNYRFVLIFFLIGLYLINTKKIKLSAGNHFFINTFFVVGSLNIIIFYNWAGTHSFWSYYFLPSIVFISSISIKIILEKILDFKTKNLFILIPLFIILFFSNFYNIHKLYNYKNVKFDHDTENFINFSISNQNKLLAHSEKFYWWHGHVIKWYIDKRLSYYSEELDKKIIDDPTKYMIVLRSGVFNQIDNDLKKIFIKSKYLDVYFYQLNSDFVKNENGLEKLKKLFTIID